MLGKMDRRNFVQKTAIMGAGLALAPSLLQAQAVAKNTRDSKFKNLVKPGEKVRVAIIGCGGQGGVNTNAMKGARDPETKQPLAELVAFCDVDFDRASQIFNENPDVPRYRDYRKMLAEMGDKIDAVVISTPDHMHYPCACLAMSLGKHVYVEKPVTHTIGEARALRQLAIKSGVVTQMGNHGHAYDGCRILREWIEADVIGEVKEVHIWTNRPVWPQGIEMDTSKKYEVPPTLDWNLWLGISPFVPFNPDYVPFDWRGMWNWGTGAIGDMACHMMDPITTVFDLRGNVKITPYAEGATDFSYGRGGKLKYEFAATKTRKALTLYWYEGSCKPDMKDLPDVFEGEKLKAGGMLYVGTKGVILDTDDYGRQIRLMPKAAMDDFNRTKRKEIPAKYPRVFEQNARAEFLRGCLGGPIPASNFVDHSLMLTEVGLLGVLAFRMNKTIDWDYEKGVCKGMPEANKYIHKEYRMF